MNEEVRTEMGKVAEVLRWLSNESLKKGEELKSEFHTGQGIGLMRAVMYLEDEYWVIKPVEGISIEAYTMNKEVEQQK